MYCKTDKNGDGTLHYLPLLRWKEWAGGLAAGVLRLRSEWEGERHATKGGCLAQAVMWEGDV